MCICYDDGCHLRKFSRHPTRSVLSEVTKKISEIEIVVDRFHYPNHIDDWCKRNCNPNNFVELTEVKYSYNVKLCVVIHVCCFSFLTGRHRSSRTDILLALSICPNQ